MLSNDVFIDGDFRKAVPVFILAHLAPDYLRSAIKRLKY